MGTPVSLPMWQRESAAPAPSIAGDGRSVLSPPDKPAASASMLPAETMTASLQEAPESDTAVHWDRLLRARVGRFSCGLSPPGLLLVYLDWLVHLGFSPGKQVNLLRKMLRKALRFGLYTARAAFQPETPPAIEPLPQDQRFIAPAWKRWPFNLYYQSFLFVAAVAA